MHMFSFKNIYSDNINASNLLFLTGPTKSGKSFLLKQNLEKFQKNQSARPCVFHFDFNDHPGISFDAFLVNFETLLID